MQVNVAGLRRNIKNLAHNYSDAQVKVREATSNDPWGPSATIMAEIADLTYNVVAFSEIMQMIWKRLNDHGKNWRHVYKALILLEYLIKTGTEKVAQQCKENIFAIQTLREFVYFEEGKDQGTHVREKAKQLVILLRDDERLKNERIKALKAKERFAQHPSGFGSDGYIDGPTHRDMPPGWQEEPTKPVSELEMVRPQTAGEEELQLQLAMAMSREEAEQEEAKRRSDDVRLQLALSQSEQDFNDQHHSRQQQHVPKREDQQQSHLLDLLDISFGQASISSPPLGAAGGSSTDPWGQPAQRAASQLSDPWSGTSSPPVDPWQAGGMRGASAGGMPPQPLGAISGISANGDPWSLRTHSPSVTSGSSTEGWLHSNGGGSSGGATLNGNSGGGGGAVGGDPWLTKTTIAPAAAAAPATTDNWLTEDSRAAAALSLPRVPAATMPADPWAPKSVANSDDPWKSLGNAGMKKPSPDLDDFDIITNRNKTGDLLINSGPNNNNASLLDEMDPLSSTNSSLLADTNTTNTKKPYKTPQAFLGENSSLVNLDNLIKPTAPQSQLVNSAAYNPFSDTTVIPPKTNLFQQQQPAVPSINQLKQQSFAMSINQDPWAPVNNTNVPTQHLSDMLINPFNTTEDISAERNTTTTTRPKSLNFFDDDSSSNSNNHNNNTTNTISNNFNAHMTHSRSDFDFFNTAHVGSRDLYNFNNNSHAPHYNQSDNPSSNYTQTQRNNSIDSIRNMQITTTAEVYEQPPATNKSFENSHYPYAITTNNIATTIVPPVFNSYHPIIHNPLNTAPLMQNSMHSTPYQVQNLHHNNNNAISSYPYAATAPLDLTSTLTYTATSNNSYTNALSASLAATPGVKIAPLNTGYEVNSTTYSRGAGGGISNGTGLGSIGCVDGNSGTIFSYGFIDGNPSNQNSTMMNASMNSNNCQIENNNNNNMPWIKPEAAASNPFLS